MLIAVDLAVNTLILYYSLHYHHYCSVVVVIIVIVVVVGLKGYFMDGFDGRHKIIYVLHHFLFPVPGAGPRSSRNLSYCFASQFEALGRRLV